MYIPNRRKKTGASKLELELFIFVYLYQNEAILLSHLPAPRPVSHRTAYRYIADLLQVRALPFIAFLRDSTMKHGTVVDYSSISASADPENLKRLSKKHTSALPDDEEDCLWESGGSEPYLLYRQFSGDPQRVRLHRLVSLYYLYEHEFDDCYRCVTDNCYYEEEEEDPDEVCFPHPASDVRKELTRKLQLADDALSLRTVQRDLKLLLYTIEKAARLAYQLDRF